LQVYVLYIYIVYTYEYKCIKRTYIYIYVDTCVYAWDANIEIYSAKRDKANG